MGSEFVFGNDTQLAGHADDRCYRNINASPDAYPFTKGHAAGSGHANCGTIAASNDDSRKPRSSAQSATLSDYCSHQ